jgi:hypothetical protein
MERLGSCGFVWLFMCASIAALVCTLAPGRAAALDRGTRHSSSEYERASRALPEFCRQWQSKLEQRGKDQAELLEWQDREGWQTATYRGYSPIQSCTCKLMDGVPVGELTYKTVEYYLAGHTVEEARHARPIVAGSTNTIEIVRWKDGRWVYQ